MPVLRRLWGFVIIIAVSKSQQQTKLECWTLSLLNQGDIAICNFNMANIVLSAAAELNHLLHKTNCWIFYYLITQPLLRKSLRSGQSTALICVWSCLADSAQWETNWHTLRIQASFNQQLVWTGWLTLSLWEPNRFSKKVSRFT